MFLIDVERTILILFIYLFIFVIGELSCALLIKRNSRFYYSMAVILSIFLSIVIRAAEFVENSDVGSYAFFMKLDSATENQKLEPVIWETQRFLYALIGNENYVFMITDTFASIVLMVGLKLTLDVAKVNGYEWGGQHCGFILRLFVLSLSLFPNILGMHVIYRQWVATVMVIFALAATKKSKYIGWTTFIIAILSHNVSFAALPLMLALGKYSRFSQFISTVVVVFVINFFSHLKSSTLAGVLSPFILSFVVAFVLGFVMIIGKTTAQIKMVFLWSIVIVISSPFILNSHEAMRLQYFYLAILFPWIWITIESKAKFSKLVIGLLSATVFIISIYFSIGYIF